MYQTHSSTSEVTRLTYQLPTHKSANRSDLHGNKWKGGHTIHHNQYTKKSSCLPWEENVAEKMLFFLAVRPFILDCVASKRSTSAGHIRSECGSPNISSNASTWLKRTKQSLAATFNIFLFFGRMRGAGRRWRRRRAGRVNGWPLKGEPTDSKCEMTGAASILQKVSEQNS